MEKYISSVSQSCYYQLRRISRIRPYLTEEAAKSLIHGTVISRLDYANSMFLGLPECLLGKLQKIQNFAARIICRLTKRDHITPALVSLHWLPLEERVKYKVILMVYKAMNGLAPPYLSEMFRAYVPARALRSCDSGNIESPMAKKATYMAKSQSNMEHLPCGTHYHYL